MVVRDVANGEVGGGVPIEKPHLSDKRMCRRKDGNRVGWFADNEPPIVEASDEHRHQDIADRHARVEASLGLA